jgi:hypothetical protein
LKCGCCWNCRPAVWARVRIQKRETLEMLSGVWFQRGVWYALRFYFYIEIITKLL